MSKRASKRRPVMYSIRELTVSGGVSFLLMDSTFPKREEDLSVAREVLAGWRLSHPGREFVLVDSFNHVVPESGPVAESTGLRRWSLAE